MSKPVLLVPRPLPHLQATLEYLENAGFSSLSLALSEPQPTNAPLPSGATALLLTSQLAVQPTLPNLPAYCVGQQTAQAALNVGLKVAYIGQGNAIHMAHAMLEQNLAPHTFLHPHGSNAKLEWHNLLRKKGHQVLAVEAYHPHAIPVLPAEFKKQYKQQQPTHTLLFSAGSANHLASLLKHANMAPTPKAIAFSNAVAQPAQSFWPQVEIAPKPTLAAMVTVLNNALNKE